MSEILPGIYITVRDEGLISVGGVSSGNIGIVGTAVAGDSDKLYTPGNLTEAKKFFGSQPQKEGEKKEGGNDNPAPSDETLLKALELIYGNGGTTVYAVRAQQNTATSYETALKLLENEIINIVVLAGQDASNADMMKTLTDHINYTLEIGRERIGIIGCKDSTSVDTITEKTEGNKKVSLVPAHDQGRIIYVAPGINSTMPASGAYMAAAVAGLIASLPVQSSPTNKVLNVPGLSNVFNQKDLEKLVTNRVLAIESREGYRVVKGVTTSTNTAWSLITTRRIVDYALYGVRSACIPYIGKLNNIRVRSAMKATLDGFLTRMVESEALVSYKLEVTATRQQEIAGKAIVTMTINPTFSIDYIMVTMTLG